MTSGMLALQLAAVPLPEHPWPPPRAKTRGGRRSVLIEAFERGLSIRHAARAAHVSPVTALKWASLWGRHQTCACGQPVDHRGWCRVRYQRSPARQAFIRQWSVRRRSIVEAVTP